MNYSEWIQHGLNNGWVGPVVCATHDGIPSSAEEDQQFEDGSDPCLWIMRYYEDESHRAQVEDNHAPSIWRKS